MPHLMNCPHSETGWCLDCVKAQWDELYESRIDAGKYEAALQAAAQRLEQVYTLREVKFLGLLEVPSVIDDLIADHKSLRAALKRARAYAVNKQKTHPLGLRGFAAECGVSPTKLSQWTQDQNWVNPDLF